jgi:1-acyl-sn-glycerol-3-phosphate acyltransferase
MTAGRLAIVGLYAAIFWIALPAALWLAGRGLDQALGWSTQPSLLGLAVVAPGLALVAWAVVALARDGEGLPVSALPPPRLARTGPYRQLRHPIYLGFNVAILGAGLLLGSPSLAWIVAPAFAPLWIAYAWIEERPLLRRFGPAYQRYRSSVGLLPRPPLLTLTRVASLPWPLEILGADRVPATGPALLVANHSCYLDPGFVGHTTFRRVRYLATAEVFRRSLSRACVSALGAIPVRRYGDGVSAWREITRLLDEGELVCLFPERERSALGAYQGAADGVVRLIVRLAAPVIPVGISGSYDVGPRWADVLRVRPVRVRVGEPVRFDGDDARTAVDRALSALIDVDPQPVRLAGVEPARIGRVLWRCPRCLQEEGWRAAELRCAACGACWHPTRDGWFLDDRENRLSLAALAGPVHAAPAGSSLRLPARGAHEPSVRGPIHPLVPLGNDVLELTPERLTFGALRVPVSSLRSLSVEGANTLQVASAESMWQFRIRDGSAFRCARALSSWRGGDAAL